MSHAARTISMSSQRCSERGYLCRGRLLPVVLPLSNILVTKAMAASPTSSAPSYPFTAGNTPYFVTAAHSPEVLAQPNQSSILAPDYPDVVFR
jgi:hypothetical protein